MYVLGPGDEALLDAFYRDVYLPAFAHQREPVEAWRSRLGARGGPYQHTIIVEGAHLADPARRRIDGGIVLERYPRSACGLITYLVVAPAARRRGLGAQLLARARAELGGALLVVGEVHDPAHAQDRAAAHARIAFFERRGARVLDVGYVQPDLGAGLGRDRHLRLIAFFDPARQPPASIDGARLRDFLREFYDVVEGRHDDAEIEAMLASIPDAVRVLTPGELQRVLGTVA